MIKIVQFDAPPGVPTYRTKTQHLKRELVKVLNDSQLTFLKDRRWVCRQHPARSDRIEIFMDIEPNTGTHTLARLIFS